MATLRPTETGVHAIIGLGSQADVIEAILIHQGITNIIRLVYGDHPAHSTHAAHAAHSTHPAHPAHPAHLNTYLESHHPPTQYILAIGDNKTRHDIAMQYPGLTWFNAISPRADIADNVVMGVGNVICAGSVIATHSSIGSHCIINTNSSIDHHCKIGSYVHVAPNCAVCGNVQLHDGVFIGVSTSVTPKTIIRPWAFHRANSVVSKSSGPIPIYQPFTGEYKAVLNALETGWISSQGSYIKQTQQLLQARLGLKHVLLLANGTCATHCLFIALKYRYPNISKIYVPDSCYIAAINSALYEYPLSTLEVMKLDESTWNVTLSEDYWASLEPGAAVLIVHNIGKLLPVPMLKQRRPDLIFVEDACEALFGTYGGTTPTSVGVASLCASFSFFANKTITCGEGGAFVTEDTDLFEYMSKVCNQGVSSTRYLHDCLGYNYRITNVQAALLHDQLQYLDTILAAKGRIFAKYMSELPREYQQGEDSTTLGAQWIFAIRIPGLPSFEFAETFLKTRGVDIRPFFFPVDVHGHTKDIKRLHPGIPELLHQEIIMLPSYPDLTELEVDHIIESVRELFAAVISKG